MTTTFSELRRVSRSLLSSPALVFVTALSIGLGVGANLTIFAALRDVFWSSPSVADPERLVGVEPGNSNQLSYLNLRDLDEAAIFESVVGFRPVRMNLRASTALTRVDALAVTAGFFEHLGVAVARGRAFQTDEAAPERSPRMVVITDRFWRRVLGADPGAVGRALTLDGEPFDIIGVLPADHASVVSFLPIDLYVPVSALVLPTITDRSNGNALAVIGRLHPEATAEQAEAALRGYGVRMEERYPTENAGMAQPSRALSLATREFGGWQEPFFISAVLFALVGLVLLSACANVGGLLMARATSRQRELAVRLALGANRGRLIRMLLVESLALSALGSVFGLVLYVWFTRLLANVVLPAGAGTLSLTLTFDGALGLYAMALAIAAGLLCGSLPALRATRPASIGDLKGSDARGTTARLRMRHVFVVGQVAVSLLLLVLSSLLLRSLARITTLSPGFDVDRVAVAMVHVDGPRYLANGGLPLGLQLVERMATVPGVQSASFANIVALGADRSATRPQVEGLDDHAGARTFLNNVGPAYFATLGIPLVSGRDFDARDRDGSPAVAVVSEAFVRAYLPGAPPQAALGRSVRRGPNEPWAEIIGVVRDSKYGSVAEDPSPILYRAYTQVPRVSSQVRPLALHVRTSGDPGAALDDIRRVIAEVEPNLAADVMTLRSATGTEAELRLLGTRLLGTIGGIALLLAMVGLYGLMAYVVSSRTAEIGTRMALGAGAGRILRDTLVQGTRMVGVGVLLGGVLAWLAAQALVAALAGVSPADPWAFGLAATVLLVVGLASCYVPARRASRMDPAVALRAE